MYLWSCETLEAELARGQVSEREKVKYLLLPMLLTALGGGPIYLVTPNFGPQHPPLTLLISFLSAVLVAVVTFYGLRHVYRTNQKIDGRGVLERYVVLSLPVHVRFIALLLPVTIALALVFHALKPRFPGAADFFATWFSLLFPGFMIWLYRMIAASFRRFGHQLQIAARFAAPPPSA